jgi:regulator of RNase E activity RraA
MKSNSPQLSADQLQALRLLDACIVANSIETFNERLRNVGFANGAVRSLFPQMEPMVGYAATIKVRGSAPPTASGLYPDRTDLWDYILSLPAPRVVVVQDMATRIGLGSLVGAVHMNILHALGCIGAVTNGSVRDIPAAQSLGFQLFSGSVAVSHAYVHIVEFGKPVEIAGLEINSGDLLHGDQHGIQSIPLDLAAQIPAIAAQIREKEQAIIALCHSADFSLDNLRSAVAKQKS